MARRWLSCGRGCDCEEPCPVAERRAEYEADPDPPDEQTLFDLADREARW